MVSHGAAERRSSIGVAECQLSLTSGHYQRFNGLLKMVSRTRKDGFTWRVKGSVEHRRGGGSLEHYQ